MKILICSDSHRRLDLFQKVIEKEVPQIVLFTGDHSMDAIDMSLIYNEIQFFIVKGNTDFIDYETPDKLILELEGKKIMLVHGHLFGVKSYMQKLEEEAEKEGVDICFFGHTHISYYKKVKEILYVNPGALQNGKYAVWEKDKINMKNL